MQISDIFHNCPEQEQQQCKPKDLGSKFPWSKKKKNRNKKSCISTLLNSQTFSFLWKIVEDLPGNKLKIPRLKIELNWLL